MAQRLRIQDNPLPPEAAHFPDALGDAAGGGLNLTGMSVLTNETHFDVRLSFNELNPKAWTACVVQLSFHFWNADGMNRDASASLLWYRGDPRAAFVGWGPSDEPSLLELCPGAPGMARMVLPLADWTGSTNFHRGGASATTSLACKDATEYEDRLSYENERFLQRHIPAPGALVTGLALLPLALLVRARRRR